MALPDVIDTYVNGVKLDRWFVNGTEVFCAFMNGRIVFNRPKYITLPCNPSARVYNLQDIIAAEDPHNQYCSYIITLNPGGNNPGGCHHPTIRTGNLLGKFVTLVNNGSIEALDHSVLGALIIDSSITLINNGYIRGYGGHGGAGGKGARHPDIDKKYWKYIDTKYSWPGTPWYKFEYTDTYYVGAGERHWFVYWGGYSHPEDAVASEITSNQEWRTEFVVGDTKYAMGDLKSTSQSYNKYEVIKYIRKIKKCDGGEGGAGGAGGIGQYYKQNPVERNGHPGSIGQPGGCPEESRGYTGGDGGAGGTWGTKGTDGEDGHPHNNPPGLRGEDGKPGADPGYSIYGAGLLDPDSEIHEGTWHIAGPILDWP